MSIFNQFFFLIYILHEEWIIVPDQCFKFHCHIINPFFYNAKIAQLQHQCLQSTLTSWKFIYRTKWVISLMIETIIWHIRKIWKEKYNKTIMIIDFFVQTTCFVFFKIFVIFCARNYQYERWILIQQKMMRFNCSSRTIISRPMNIIKVSPFWRPPIVHMDCFEPQKTQEPMTSQENSLHSGDL